MAQLFDRIFERYQRHNTQPDIQLLRQWEEGVLRSMTPESCVRGKSVLSIGCGEARDADRGGWLDSFGMATFSGIDSARKMVNLARQRHDGDRRVVIANTSIEDLRVAGENIYGLAISRLVLHWVQDANAAASKVFRLLQPGGAFVFSVEHPNGQEAGNGDFMSTSCLRFHRDQDEWHRTLRKAGFRGIRFAEPRYNAELGTPYLFAVSRKA